MLLSDFLTTRVVEPAVHGVDVAGCDPWLTTGPADLILDLLFGSSWPQVLTEP